mmetsp:Transcript_83545/g.233154  ORF Transcript_83545/g.233154 Transcript_83545/m.233154 type:complete len:259 (+) Transcript_83545:48-824(+)
MAHRNLELRHGSFRGRCGHPCEPPEPRGCRRGARNPSGQAFCCPSRAAENHGGKRPHGGVVRGWAVERIRGVDRRRTPQVESASRAFGRVISTPDAFHAADHARHVAPELRRGTRRSPDRGACWCDVRKRRRLGRVLQDSAWWRGARVVWKLGQPYRERDCKAVGYWCANAADVLDAWYLVGGVHGAQFPDPHVGVWHLRHPRKLVPSWLRRHNEHRYQRVRPRATEGASRRGYATNALAWHGRVCAYLRRCELRRRG